MYLTKKHFEKRISLGKKFLFLLMSNIYSQTENDYIKVKEKVKECKEILQEEFLSCINFIEKNDNTKFNECLEVKGRFTSELKKCHLDTNNSKEELLDELATDTLEISHFDAKIKKMSDEKSFYTDLQKLIEQDLTKTEKGILARYLDLYKPIDPQGIPDAEEQRTQYDTNSNGKDTITKAKKEKINECITKYSEKIQNNSLLCINSIEKNDNKKFNECIDNIQVSIENNDNECVNHINDVKTQIQKELVLIKKFNTAFNYTTNLISDENKDKGEGEIYTNVKKLTDEMEKDKKQDLTKTQKGILEKYLDLYEPSLSYQFSSFLSDYGSNYGISSALLLLSSSLIGWKMKNKIALGSLMAVGALIALAPQVDFAKPVTDFINFYIQNFYIIGVAIALTSLVKLCSEIYSEKKSKEEKLKTDNEKKALEELNKQKPQDKQEVKEAKSSNKLIVGVSFVSAILLIFGLIYYFIGIDSVSVDSVSA